MIFKWSGGLGVGWRLLWSPLRQSLRERRDCGGEKEAPKLHGPLNEAARLLVFFVIWAST